MNAYCECGAYILSREDGAPAEPHRGHCRWYVFATLMREYANA